MINRKGTLLLTIIFAVAIYLFGMLFVDFIDSESEDAAATTTASGLPGLNCGPSSNPNMDVSDGTKLACLATDAATPYFIWAIISLAGGSLLGALLK